VEAYRATACTIAPRIDGVDSPGEWAGATRAEFDLAMGTAKGETRPPRRAELRFMNSSVNLYIAFRVPDAARDLQMTPLVADLVVLAFCRGAELAEGDDRRVLLPGLYADKHVVSPGKDADDAQRDGTGAMRWQAGAGGGEYFVEWQIPLASGDKNDISTVPGGRLRFNLVYADRFSPTLAETEFGGRFGADADHAQAWGTLTLASEVGPEAPAPAPEWLARCFPHTGAPDRLAHRLRRLDASEIDVKGQLAGSVIVELTYPGLDGRDEVGQARLFLPPVLHDQPSARVPLVHVAGYEIDEGGAAGLLALGYAVSTPHAHPLNPLGRGVYLDRAILHAARQLPCVDARRVSIQGGSAGGWMTLMLSADAFPLVWAMADVPPIHWGYNADYIASQQANAGPVVGSDAPRLPFVRIVGGIAEQARSLYGMPFDSPAYLALSPLAHLDTITAPTQVIFTTADMLVPVDQVGADLVQAHDPKLFPEGFSTALAERFPSVNGQRTLLGALPAERCAVYRLPLIAAPTLLGPGGVPQGDAKPLVLPFAADKVWSIAVVEEGPVGPQVGHFKYHWAVDHEPFRRWADARGAVADQLTAPKLERLMMRLRGTPWRPLRVRPHGQAEEVVGNQLDYPEAETADVLLGLTAFATDDACATRLGTLYAQLPVDLKALGAALGDGSAAGVRAALAAAAPAAGPGR
jgi:hypothetical protein